MSDQPALPQPLGATLRDLVARLQVQAEAMPAPTPSPPVCPTCRGRGFLVADVSADHPAFGQLVRCACHPARVRADLVRATGAALADPPRTLTTFAPDRAVDRVLRWRTMTYSQANQVAALAQALAAVQAFIAGSGPAWCYLCGPCGSGKSHLAQAVYHALAPNHPAAYLTAAGLVAYLRDGVERQEADARLAALQQVPLLIIDDLGSERPTSWGLARLFDVIDARSSHRRPTFITSNLPLDELVPEDAPRAEQLAYERIVSRIAGCCERPLELAVSDYRRSHWEETR